MVEKKIKGFAQKRFRNNGVQYEVNDVVEETEDNMKELMSPEAFVGQNKVNIGKTKEAKDGVSK